ncbi:MAG: hypothetical protein B6245_22180 [Desulfobacteraceae bacterium 4572_88]|nr:MAG: hypothetical protein B6245_22180 [Desulfobacteraceae bacterium 4572_88]
MMKIDLTEIKNQSPEYLQMAEREEVVINRHGRPAGVLIGFGSEDDWLDYFLENDLRFLTRIESARQSLREGRESDWRRSDSNNISRGIYPSAMHSESKPRNKFRG